MAGVFENYLFAPISREFFGEKVARGHRFGPVFYSASAGRRFDGKSIHQCTVVSGDTVVLSPMILWKTFKSLSRNRSVTDDKKREFLGR